MGSIKKENKQKMFTKALIAALALVGTQAVSLKAPARDSDVPLKECDPMNANYVMCMEAIHSSADEEFVDDCVKIPTVECRIVRTKVGKVEECKTVETLNAS